MGGLGNATRGEMTPLTVVSATLLIRTRAILGQIRMLMTATKKPLLWVYIRVIRHSGNVWEWCIDELDIEFYENSPKENPVSGGLTLLMPNNFTSITERRILRGGSWHSTPEILRVAYRYSSEPAVTLSYFGFRCVVPVDP